MTGLLLNLRGIYNKPISATAPAFDPATLFANGEDGFWYDPSDTSTMWATTTATIQTVAASAGVTATAGNLVARIDDKSGNGVHATQATLADRPILRQSGSLYYLEFDGAGDRLLTNSGQVSGFSGIGLTLGLDHVAGNTSSDGMVVFYPFGRGGFILRYDNNNSRYEWVVLNQSGSTAEAAASTQPPVTQVLTAEADLTAPEISIGLDGVTQDTATPPSTGMFARSYFYEFFNDYEGGVHQLIFVGRSYTTSEKTDAENYVAAKTGVTL